MFCLQISTSASVVPVPVTIMNLESDPDATFLSVVKVIIHPVTLENMGLLPPVLQTRPYMASRWWYSRGGKIFFPNMARYYVNLVVWWSSLIRDADVLMTFWPLIQTIPVKENTVYTTVYPVAVHLNLSVCLALILPVACCCWCDIYF